MSYNPHKMRLNTKLWENLGETKGAEGGKWEGQGQQKNWVVAKTI